MKELHEEETNLLQELGISVDTETAEIYLPLTQIPEVIEPPAHGGSALDSNVRILTVSHEFYADICNIINKTYQSLERKQSLYTGMDEENLRDYLLPVIETRYTGVTATGETFKKTGKTDVLVTHVDGTDVFIAECKFWKGPESLTKAISQLFNRYVTCKNTKVAVICFVPTRNSPRC